MNVLIVHADPSPGSFLTSLAQASAEFLVGEGHDVAWSDLYAMSWNPVFGGTHPDRVSRAADLHREIQKLEACELVILSFPLWWYGPPAILKGWIDQVFAEEFAYASGRSFETGLLSGKAAMCLLTAGATEDSFTDEGRSGTLDAILYPIHHAFRYVGMTIAPPFAAYATRKMSNPERAEEITRLRRHLMGLRQPA